MQSLFYGAAAAGVAGLLLGAGFRTAPQTTPPPQPDAVYAQDQAAPDDGFQPAYLQGAVYSPAGYVMALGDPSSQPASKDVAQDPPQAKLDRVSFDADPPPHGDDIPAPTEPSSAPATASSTSPGPSTSPPPGGPSQRQDDQNAPSSRSSTSTPSSTRAAPTQPPATQPAAPNNPAPAPGQPSPEAMTPQGPHA
jgi:hypothetical protein